jgi:hypothetical protein
MFLLLVSKWLAQVLMPFPCHHNQFKTNQFYPNSRRQPAPVGNHWLTPIAQLFPCHHKKVENQSPPAAKINAAVAAGRGGGRNRKPRKQCRKQRQGE